MKFGASRTLFLVYVAETTFCACGCPASWQARRCWSNRRFSLTGRSTRRRAVLASRQLPLSRSATEPTSVSLCGISGAPAKPAKPSMGAALAGDGKALPVLIWPPSRPLMPKPVPAPSDAQGLRDRLVGGFEIEALRVEFPSRPATHCLVFVVRGIEPGFEEAEVSRRSADVLGEIGYRRRIGDILPRTLQKVRLAELQTGTI